MRSEAGRPGTTPAEPADSTTQHPDPIPTDEGEGEWWLEDPAYHAARAAEDERWRAWLERPREPSPEWWAGCLAGLRLGLELARLARESA